MDPLPTTTTLLLLLVLFLTSTTNPAQLFPREAIPTGSGYLPISNSSSSALYYAFYEARQPHIDGPHRTPLLLWLQGGPGCSSMIGNLFELGPFLLTTTTVSEPSLEFNPNSWNREFGIVFVDNPVGTGFSVASEEEDIPRDQNVLSFQLWFALQAFFSSHPSFRQRPFYVTGESYAGKYVPALAYYIQQKNPHINPLLRINLMGVAIGNGLTHPVTQVATHAVSAYYNSLINKKQQRELEEIQSEAVRLTKAEQWAAASDARKRVLGWLQNVTGLATLYDLRRTKPYEKSIVTSFLKHEEARIAFGVTRPQPFEDCNGTIGEFLHEDVMKSVKHMVEALLKEKSIRVLLYQGQFDLRDSVVSTEAWVEEMEDWDGLPTFLDAGRVVWRVDGEVAGYVQRSGLLTQVVVGGAGHLVPRDQGRRAQAMIEGWIRGDDLFGEGKEGDGSKLRRSC